MEIELSVVMPCLNEAETLEVCIKKAQAFLSSHGVAGEVIIADNGSTDGSIKIAESNGARVIHVEKKGYGNALKGGIDAAKGKFIIMGDADDSYDFSNLMPFITKLREGYDLVMGNRFKGGIEKGAMPFLHKYLGNPVLSFIGKLFFKVNINDFHCGLRGFSKMAYEKMALKTTGMEFASEMVVKASLNKFRIMEVPTTLSKDGRSRPPHLNTWRDGWRHLRFLLLYSPKWLFMIPGMTLMIIGLIFSAILMVSPIKLEHTTLDYHTLLFTSGALVIGFQFILFYGLTKVYAVEQGLLPKSNKYEKMFQQINLEKGLIFGGVLIIIGLILSCWAFYSWFEINLGDINNNQTIRISIAGITTILLGVQTILFSLYFSILGLNK